MRQAAVWVLTIAGLAGLCLALGFEGRGGPQGWVYRVGYPDAWVEWESTPGGHTYGVNVLRWSFGILVASVYALYYAVRIRRTTPGATGVFWALLVGGLLVLGGFVLWLFRARA